MLADRKRSDLIVCAIWGVYAALLLLLLLNLRPLWLDELMEVVATAKLPCVT